jgi:16S rRNA (guanine(527)-N(7))-methyltransferase RsmG
VADLQQIIQEQYVWVQKHLGFETVYFSDLTDTEISKLAMFLGLIKHWTLKIDLVSPQSDEMLVSRHILDCVCSERIVASQNIEANLNFVDVGSGAGLPGIVLAILDQKRVVHLVEPRQKRCFFLNEVKQELKLENVLIHELDFLTFSRMVKKITNSPQVKKKASSSLVYKKMTSTFQIGLIIARAIGMREQYIKIAKGLIDPAGFVVEMLGKVQSKQNILTNSKLYNFLLPPDSAQRSLLFW